jgi:hypothetical protein
MAKTLPMITLYSDGDTTSIDLEKEVLILYDSIIVEAGVTYKSAQQKYDIRHLLKSQKPFIEFEFTLRSYDNFTMVNKNLGPLAHFVTYGKKLKQPDLALARKFLRSVEELTKHKRTIILD